MQKQEVAMDAIIEIVKAIGTVAVIGVILIAIPILMVFIFEIATGLDDRLTR